MPPEAQPKQGLTTPQLITISVLAGLLAGGVAATVAYFSSPEKVEEKFLDDDPDEGLDERPPIIINNGSVLLHPKKQGGGYMKDPGKWELIPGTLEKSYRHTSVYVPPSMLKVQFSGPPGKEDCTRSGFPGHYKTPVSGTSFTLTYMKPDENAETITVRIDGDHLRADFPEKPGANDVEKELYREAGQGDWTLVMDAKWTCTFEVKKDNPGDPRKPILRVYQIK